MDYSYMDPYMFEFRLQQIKENLNDISKTLICTMYQFAETNFNTKRSIRFFSNAELLNELERIKLSLEDIDNDMLEEQFDILKNSFQNGAPRLDLLIKLDCALGIYPNEFFLKYSRKIFCNEIYLKIITGTFTNEGIFENRVNGHNDQDDLFSDEEDNLSNDEDYEEDVAQVEFVKTLR